MTIDDVVARSRLPGGFATHKRFTIARERAIEKLRKFALADPHDYILEFVQAAVASGASSIGLAIDDESCSISWIGGGLTEGELGQLFDFLFASQDRTDIDHVRALVLGINAALGFRPGRVVVESGDGTLAGTSRLELAPESNRVEIGRAAKPLLGTYVLLDRFAEDGVARRHCARLTVHALEFRCLCAPIPILVNGDSLFGPSRQRLPAMFGYDKVLGFDEGELYGVLGLDPCGGPADFRLLTRGVAIQSKQHTLVPGRDVGGIVCFDRLRKTVDHAGIVEDERLAEMWLRLRPYAEELVTGVRRTISSTSVLGGPPLTTAELCELLRDGGRVVIVHPDVGDDDSASERAWAIGRALQAAVLCVPAEQRAALRLIAGTTSILEVDARDDAALAFYTSAPAEPPARPWLAAPLVPAALPTTLVAAELVADGIAAPQEHAALVRALGCAELLTTIHTPAAATCSHGVEVRIVASTRLAHLAVVPSRHAGHVVTVQLGDADFACLRRSNHRGTMLADELAREVVEALDDALDRATQVALGANVSLAPGTNARRLAWSALLHHTILRLAHRDGAFVLRFAQIGAQDIDLLALPLVRTHAGASIGLAGVQDLLARTEGTLAIAAAGADLRGLDPADVVEIDDTQTVLLADVVGAAVLLPVAAAPSDDSVPRLLASARDAAADPLDRHLAVARLQAAAARVLAEREPDPHGLLTAPLFLGEDDRVYALASLDGDVLRLEYAPDATVRAMHAMVADAPLAPGAPRTLFTTPAVATILARRIPVHAASDLSFDVRRVGASATALLAEVTVADRPLSGRLGVPARAVPPSIVIVSADDRSSAELLDLARTYGVSGILRLSAPLDDRGAEAVIERVRAAAERVLADLLTRVRADPVADAERAWSVMLDHAARMISLHWQADGSLVALTHGAVAAQVLRTAILPIVGGQWSTPASLLDRWCRGIAAREPDPLPQLLATLASDLPAPIAAWVAAVLDPRRVPPRPRPIAPPLPPATDLSSFASAIATWLFHLRPDRVQSVPTIVCIDRFDDDSILVRNIWERITINEWHPLVQNALARPRDPETVAWLLLAIYAHVNALRVEVGNAHEREFHGRVVEALLADQLRLA